MATNLRIIFAREYDRLQVVENPTKHKLEIKKTEFEALRDLALEANNTKESRNIFKVDTIKKTIQVQNYVGYIQTAELGLEILPKVDLAKKDKEQTKTCEILPKVDLAEKDKEHEKTREIFLKMLQVFFGFNSIKEFPETHLDLAETPIWEALITMFLAEIAKLLKKGIKKDYRAVQDNLPFWKGRLLFSQDLQKNLTNKARFFLEFDEYSPNRPENRLLKSCLKFLLRHSNNAVNQQKIRQSLGFFSEVPDSQNYQKDFRNCDQKNRMLKDYQLLLKWCKVFLQKKSFSTFHGKNFAISLLFPMEKIFESYVSWCFKEYQTDFSVKLQSTAKWLCEEEQGNKKFQLRPDLKLEKGALTVILDAKWKALNSNAKQDKYNIKESDFYQILAYNRVHDYKETKCPQVFLIYPKTKKFDEKINFIFQVESEPQCICFPFQLDNAEKSTKDLISSINKEKA